MTIFRRHSRHQHAILRKQCHFDADAIRQAIEILFADQALDNNGADYPTADNDRRHRADRKAVQTFNDMHAFLAVQGVGHTDRCFLIVEPLNTALTRAFDQLAAGVVYLDQTDPCVPAFFLRPLAYSTVGVDLSRERRHQIAALHQRTGTTLDRRVIGNNLRFDQPCSPRTARLLLDQELTLGALMMEVIADSNRPAGHQHQHADQRPRNGAKA